MLREVLGEEVDDESCEYDGYAISECVSDARVIWKACLQNGRQSGHSTSSMVYTFLA